MLAGQQVVREADSKGSDWVATRSPKPGVAVGWASLLEQKGYRAHVATETSRSAEVEGREGLGSRATVAIPVKVLNRDHNIRVVLPADPAPWEHQVG